MVVWPCLMEWSTVYWYCQIKNQCAPKYWERLVNWYTMAWLFMVILLNILLACPAILKQIRKYHILVQNCLLTIIMEKEECFNGVLFYKMCWIHWIYILILGVKKICQFCLYIELYQMRKFILYPISIMRKCFLTENFVCRRNSLRNFGIL